MTQKIFKHQEGSAEWQQFCSKLKSLIPELRKEFFSHYDSIQNRLAVDGSRVFDYNKKLDYDMSKDIECLSQEDLRDGWQIVSLKYVDHLRNLHEIRPDLIKKFPVAGAIIEELGDNCPIAIYSCLAPQTTLKQHTDFENKDGKTIRIQVPLVVPEGDIFLDVDGEKQYWDTVFGFDNRTPHSAHNNTNEWRLIFIIDVNKEFLNLVN